MENSLRQIHLYVREIRKWPECLGEVEFPSLSAHRVSGLEFGGECRPDLLLSEKLQCDVCLITGFEGQHHIFKICMCLLIYSNITRDIISDPAGCHTDMLFQRGDVAVRCSKGRNEDGAGGQGLSDVSPTLRLSRGE